MYQYAPHVTYTVDETSVGEVRFEGVSNTLSVGVLKDGGWNELHSHYHGTPDQIRGLVRSLVESIADNPESQQWVSELRTELATRFVVGEASA